MTDKNINQTVKEIIGLLNQYKDQQRLELAQRNYPSKLEIIGARVPDIKHILKDLKEITKTWSREKKIYLCKSLVNTPYHECHHLAYYFLEKEQKTLKTLSLQDAEDLAVCLDNWVLVDTYSSYILGVLWRIGTIEDNYIHNLLQSEDFWQRRCALVATVALNQTARGGKGNAARTLAVCEKKISDHHPMIYKALSWALRALIKPDREAVEQFMEKHHKKLHRQVVREVRNKLETGLKNPN